MREVKLEINDVTNNVLGDFDLMSHEDFPLTLNYVIADINQLDKRSGSYSKTFLIPATKKNNKLLKLIFDTNANDDFKWFEEKPCRIIVNNLPILKGKLRVNNVTNKKNGYKEYEVTVLGNNMEWIKELDEIDISELDFNTPADPTGTHTYDKATIEASWSGDISSHDYYYPVINYGKWVSPPSFFHMTLIPFGAPVWSVQDHKGVVVEDMRPSLYILTIIERALDEIGWSLSSAFMNTARFKDLVYAFVGSDFLKDPAFIESNKVIVKRVSHRILGSGSGGTALLFNNEVYDPLNQFILQQSFTPDESGLYTFKMDFEVQYTPQAPYFFRLILDVFNVTDGVKEYTQQSGNSATSMSFNSGEIFCDSSKVYRVIYSTSNTSIPSVLWLPSTNLNGVTTNELQIIPSLKLIDGSEYKIKDILEPNTTALDILKGLIHSFNLYIYTDNITKVIYIEPRESFFEPFADSVNWSQKLDLDSDYKVQFIHDYNRDFGFRFLEDDRDGHLKQRNEAHGNIAGEYIHGFSNRFPKGMEVSENPTFSYSYHILDLLLCPKALTPTGQPAPVITDKYSAPLMARLWKEFRGDMDAPDPYYDFKPRLLYKDYSIQLDPDGQSIRWRWEDTTQSNFPSALSEGFGILPNNTPITYGQSTGSANDGLFKEHYSQEFALIEKGTFLTCYMNLDTFDLNTLDFRKYVYIHAPNDIKGYWVLNKIIDFSPINPKLTQVELFKYEEIIPESLNPRYEMSKGSNESNFGDLSNAKAIGGESGFFSKGQDNAMKERESGMSYLIKSACLDNGSGNSALSGTGSSVVGFGLKSNGDKEQVLGRFNDAKLPTQWSVGAGDNEGARATALQLDESGAFQVYGGELWTEVGGELKLVITEVSGSLTKVYIDNE